MKDLTKQMFANELEQMLKEMPIDKIRTTDLCKRCETIPATFYYHFHDKYELIAWIFLKDFFSGISGKKGYAPEILEQINKQIENRKNFYQKAYGDTSQNSIEKYVMSFTLQIAQAAYEHANNGHSMTPDQITALKYHNYGVQGLFKEWIFGNGDITSREMSDFLFTKTPNFMKEALSNYQYSSNIILKNTGKKTKVTE